MSRACSHEGCDKLVFARDKCHIHDGSKVPPPKKKKRSPIDMSRRTMSTSRDGTTKRAYKQCTHAMGVEILQKSLANATVMALLEEHVASKNVITRPRSMDSAASISRLLKITLVMKQSKTLEWSSGNSGILKMTDKQNSRQDTLQWHSILRMN